MKRFNWLLFLAQGGGSGLLRPAPGTWGTLLAVLLFVPLSFLPYRALLPLLLFAFAFGIYLCGCAAQDLKQKDPSSIVWDEMVAMWLLLAHLPSGLSAWGGAFALWAWAFVLFRVFDIWKPYPIKALEKRFSGGFGIMVDDILAAAYALIVLYALQLLIKSWHTLGYLLLLALLVLVVIYKRFKEKKS